MKKIYLILVWIVFACSSENANDCFQKAGKIIQEEIPVATFEKILVKRNIKLTIKQGDTYSVRIETGENLMPDVTATVTNNQLILNNKNTCNLVRDYGITKVYVTTPTLTEVRSDTQYTIKSDGVLTYPNLRLISEDFNNPDYNTVGDFNLQVQAQSLNIVSNNISSFYLFGNTQNLNVGFYSGSGRFEGENLIAQNVNIYHRGTNDIIVNPQEELTGEIRSTGDVIAVNQPNVVQIEAFYAGKLIFR